MKIKMPVLPQHRIDGFTNSNEHGKTSHGFWSKHCDDVSYNQLQKFWSGLSLQDRQELLRIDKQTLFGEARKNMYCSRCNGSLLEGFLQIVIYGKSSQQEGAEALKNQTDVDYLTKGSQDEMQDLSILPWGGLTATRDGSLTLSDCYLCSKTLKGLQNVFDTARARERECELLYPDACGGGGRGWITQGMASNGRGYGTREACALHTARLSCGKLVDFWSALGEETRHSLLRMKEEDFIERLIYRFDSKRFCRDCRKNVIREFKELKELKRLHREPRCTTWFCVADSAFQYEVSDDTVHVDWGQTFGDSVGMYHHFEWAVGTGEGKSDILEFENVDVSGSVQVSGLDLQGLRACYITLRAWKLDGCCAEMSVKAHALKGHQCVHSRLLVGDGYVSITRGESIRKFFEHAEEVEEDEDDDFLDDDGNEDGECYRPQRHAKSPEIAREFLLDAATVIFKDQVEKALREDTARRNAHSILVCLALKLLEERVHVACKEIITLEKQMKLLEEEEKEKREEEERKERRKIKEKEKRQRRKERLKGKEREKGRSVSESNTTSAVSVVTKEDLTQILGEVSSNALECIDSASETVDIFPPKFLSPNIQDEQPAKGCVGLAMQSDSYERSDVETTTIKSGAGSSTFEQSKFTRRKQKIQKFSCKSSEGQQDSVVSGDGSVGNRSEGIRGDSCVIPSRAINGQARVNGPRCNTGITASKYKEIFYGRIRDKYSSPSCSCNQSKEYRAKFQPCSSVIQSGQETKSLTKSVSVLDISKQGCHGDEDSQIERVDESWQIFNSKNIIGSNSNGHLNHSNKVWEPLESEKHPPTNSGCDVTMKMSSLKVGGRQTGLKLINSSIGSCSRNASGILDEISCEDKNMEGTRRLSLEEDYRSQNKGVEEKDACHLMGSTVLSVGLYTSKDSSLVSASGSSSSSSDNCSSCLSEEESNPASSNNGNTESSSTSDSEDASQPFKGQRTAKFIQNGFGKCDDGEKHLNQIGNGECAYGNRKPLGCQESRVVGSSLSAPLPNIAQRPNSGKATVGLGSPLQGVVSEGHRPSISFPMFQAPSAMSLYHQPPISRPTGPAGGFFPFSQPNHYACAGPLGYGLNGNSSCCMQSGPLHNITRPVINAEPLPFYQPDSRVNNMIPVEKCQTCMPNPVLQQANGPNADKGIATGPSPVDAQPKREEDRFDDFAKMPDDSFSFFYFGGPVALSSVSKSDPVISKDKICGNFTSKISLYHVENGRELSEKETRVQEYNLFAAGNGIKSSFF